MLYGIYTSLNPCNPNPHPNHIKGTFFRPFFNLLLSLATPLAVTVDEEILIALVSQVTHPFLQRV